MAKRINLIAAGVVMSLAAMAQQNPVPLKQLLETALKHNQTLEVSRYDQDLVEYQIAEARARALPLITGSGNVANNYKRPVIVLPPGAFPSADGTPSNQPTKLVSGTSYSSSLGVDVSQPLFDMAAFTAVKAAKAGREYYRFRTRQAEEDVITQVAQAYYNILASRQTIQLQESNIENLEKLVNVADGQFKNGLARKIDLDRLKVSLINSQSQHIQAINQLATQDYQLKVLLGVSLDTDIVLAEIPLEEIEALAAQTGSRNEFDVTNQTDVLLLNSQITLSQLQLKATKAERYPRLSAYVNYSQNVLTNNYGNVFGGNDAINYGLGSAGLRLNIPIFDGFARQSRLKQNAVQIRQLEKQKEATVLSSNASYRSAKMQMQSSLATLKSQHENVILAQEVYVSSQANYNLGLTSLTDLLDAQNSYTQAQNIYTRELLNYKLAELGSLRSTGHVKQLLEL